MILTAYDCGKAERGYTFGVALTADELRKLADRIERNEVIVQRVHVVSRADAAEFAQTTVVLTLHERRA